MTDSDVKQMMEYQENRKSLAVTYILWFFLGMFGAHRFYLEKMGTAVAMLILTLSLIGIVVSWVWWIVDLFLNPSMVREINSEIIDEVTGSS